MDFELVGLPQIRWMLSDDIESVMSIEQDDVSESWNSRRFETEIRHSASRYIVLDVTTPVSAFGGLWLGVDQVRVVTMATRKSERRRGYGGLVLRGLLAVAADFEMTTATLECRSGNSAARALYRKFGFIEVGARRSYYADGEDAIIMTTETFDSPSFRTRLARLDEEVESRSAGFVPMPPGPAPPASSREKPLAAEGFGELAQ
jgi:[ribosomal protein S18]-alanine N-acetyltransferase